MNECTPEPVEVLAPDRVGVADNNDVAETWDHLCGPDPYWAAALEDDDD